MSGWGKYVPDDEPPKPAVNQREQQIRDKLGAARKWAKGDSNIVVFNPTHYAVWEDIAYLLDLITELRSIIRVRGTRE